MNGSAPSFARDIEPILATYRDQMAWRLDLSNYDDVVANSSVILGVISPGGGMPPPGFPPFPPSFVALFTTWMYTNPPPP